eukprot:TRINITY_DN511_c0_g1_i11.p1 TRINITY_DN511_c0_g1~~TRINITY_DN511_c0_g1_i11.p1  ORF type:complete len:226 (-),score=-1.56 TRINITY_DN511_c0_g1_i11:370-1047(-)
MHLKAKEGEFQTRWNKLFRIHTIRGQISCAVLFSNFLGVSCFFIVKDDCFSYIIVHVEKQDRHQGYMIYVPHITYVADFNLERLFIISKFFNFTILNCGICISDLRLKVLLIWIGKVIGFLIWSRRVLQTNSGVGENFLYGLYSKTKRLTYLLIIMSGKSDFSGQPNSILNPEEKKNLVKTKYLYQILIKINGREVRCMQNTISYCFMQCGTKQVEGFQEMLSAS